MRIGLRSTIGVNHLLTKSDKKDEENDWRRKTEATPIPQIYNIYINIQSTT